VLLSLEIAATLLSLGAQVIAAYERIGTTSQTLDFDYSTNTKRRIISKSNPPPIYIFHSFGLTTLCEVQELERHLSTRRQRGLFAGIRTGID
jgi:hypothetical protein